MIYKPKFLVTGVGSMPFDDPAYAVDIALANMPEAPFWPQLPKLGINEQMEIQFTEGMPRAVIDREKNRLYFDTGGDYSDEFAEFYENYAAAMDPDEGTGECSALAISRDFAAGIEARLHHKDFGILLAEAHALGAPLPVAAQVGQQLNSLMALGWGRDDTSSLLRVLETLGQP